MLESSEAECLNTFSRRTFFGLRVRVAGGAGEGATLTLSVYTLHRNTRMCLPPVLGRVYLDSEN